MTRLCIVFFFKQKTAYEMRISDWSSDVCSSDLIIDAEKGFLFLDPGDEREEIRIAVARNGAVQVGEGKTTAGSGRLHGRGSARAGTTGGVSSLPGTSRICSSTGTRAAAETSGTR